MAQVLQAGDVLDGRYRLEAKLGQGAFGAVFKGVDLEDRERPIAIKVLFDKYHEDRKMRQRFVQEARLLKDLEHPCIATAFSSRADDELAYLVMELIDGQSLDQRCEAHSEEGRHIPKQGIAWMCDQLCGAIQFAHDQGVIHRDLKPRNVMVNRAGARPFVKVLDFGIAKVLVGSEVDPTTVGRVLGSVLYIAPEQILSRPLDHRADIFSLGTIMFELLTLRRAWARTKEGAPHPFHVPVPIGDVNNHVAVLRRIAREARPSACALRADLAPAVDRVLHKALAIDANERFASAAELASALRLALLEERDVIAEAGAAAAESLEDTVSSRPPDLDVQDVLSAEPPDIEASEITERPMPRIDIPEIVTEPGALAGRGDPTDPMPAVRAPEPIEPTSTLDGGLPIPAPPTHVEPSAPPPSPPSVKPWLLLGVLAAVAAALFFGFGLQP